MLALPQSRTLQGGFSLVEVLVAVLLLSLGILTLSSTLSFSVQAPKLSGYRASAVNLASSYVERMRANAEGFANGAYDQPSSYDGSRSPQETAQSDRCAYPDCNLVSMATMDFVDLKVAVRMDLPFGGAFMQRDVQNGVASRTDGNLWILWQEPGGVAMLNAATSDNCPTEITSHDAVPAPHCLYVRFKL